MGLEEKKCDVVGSIHDLGQVTLASPRYHDHEYPVYIPFKD